MAKSIIVECRVVYTIYTEDEPSAVGLAEQNLRSDLDRLVDGESLGSIFEINPIAYVEKF